MLLSPSSYVKTSISSSSIRNWGCSVVNVMYVKTWLSGWKKNSRTHNKNDTTNRYRKCGSVNAAQKKEVLLIEMPRGPCIGNSQRNIHKYSVTYSATWYHNWAYLFAWHSFHNTRNDKNAIPSHITFLFDIVASICSLHITNKRTDKQTNEQM